MDMEIKSLAGIDFDTIFAAFGQAFADYEVQNDKEQLRRMLIRRGFDPGLSFAAFDEDKIIAFTFNGIGEFEGIPTAYDTGTGTLEEYRGKGLATKIFEYSILHLKFAGIRQYLLEVLQHNTGAVSVYRKLGFETVREFNYFIGKNEEIDPGAMATVDFNIRLMDIEQLRQVPDFWDFYPSWQNNFASIERSVGDFMIIGVFEEDVLRGYCVFEPASGDITQLAVDKNHRRRGVASLLLREMIKHNRYDSIKAVNTDVLCDSVTGFMKARNIALRGKQFEMIKAI